MTVCVIKVLSYLRYTDADVGTMVCDALQTGKEICEDKSHLDRAFP